ncbi:MAG TPA: Rdx family protein [Candidatus Saccharimonadales bacterium]|nr:Rdx family protein [Candidatus Saccharimonadales bacterium]
MKQVTITYCVPCGYIKRANLAAEALKAHLDVDVELVPGKGGIFTVEVNGKVVARRTQNHFPDTDEIVTIVAEQ